MILQYSQAQGMTQKGVDFMKERLREFGQWNRFVNRTCGVFLTLISVVLLLSRLGGWAYWYLYAFILIYMITLAIDAASLLPTKSKDKANK